MAAAPDVPPPARHAETWSLGDPALRRWARRRGAAIVALLLLLAAADQSVVRSRSAPECVTCLASFEVTQWGLCAPWHGSADARVALVALVATVRATRTASPAADWLHPDHQHVLQTAASWDAQGLVLPRESGGSAAAYPERLPGAFVVELEAEPEFGAFLRDAVARGAADPADLADAVEIFNDVECGLLTHDGPPDPRVLAATNELWAEWRGAAADDADLWGEREGN